MTTQQILDSVHKICEELEIEMAEVLISDERVIILKDDGSYVKYLLTDLT